MKKKNRRDITSGQGPRGLDGGRDGNRMDQTEGGWEKKVLGETTGIGRISPVRGINLLQLKLPENYEDIQAKTPRNGGCVS